MEFDRSRVYGAVNADELKAGDKVITARCMADLKIYVEADAKPNIIELIQDETNTDRFTCKHYGSNKTYDSPLAYLVERKENCTNCGRICSVPKTDKTARCWAYKPKTEQKAEHKCETCKYVNCGFKDFNTKNECDRWEAEPKTDDEAEKLKPCKCGCKDMFLINTGSAKINRYAVVCPGCDLLFGYNLKKGGVFVSREQAILAWNRRAK